MVDKDKCKEIAKILRLEHCQCYSDCLCYMRGTRCLGTLRFSINGQKFRSPIPREIELSFEKNKKGHYICLGRILVFEEEGDKLFNALFAAGLEANSPTAVIGFASPSLREIYFASYTMLPFDFAVKVKSVFQAIKSWRTCQSIYDSISCKCNLCSGKHKK